jgi:hypothetical protein
MPGRRATTYEFNCARRKLRLDYMYHLNITTRAQQVGLGLAGTHFWSNPKNPGSNRAGGTWDYTFDSRLTAAHGVHLQRQEASLHHRAVLRDGMARLLRDSRSMNEGMMMQSDASPRNAHDSVLPKTAGPLPATLALRHVSTLLRL